MAPSSQRSAGTSKAPCSKKSCVFYYATLAANLVLIVVTIYFFAESYGPKKYFILLLAMPPVLSIMALRKSADREERALQARLRKAQLRKELDDLKPYDTDAS